MPGSPGKKLREIRNSRDREIKATEGGGLSLEEGQRAWAGSAGPEMRAGAGPALTVPVSCPAPVWTQAKSGRPSRTLVLGPQHPAWPVRELTGLRQPKEKDRDRCPTKMQANAQNKRKPEEESGFQEDSKKGHCLLPAIALPLSFLVAKAKRADVSGWFSGRRPMGFCLRGAFPALRSQTSLGTVRPYVLTFRCHGKMLCL